MSRNTSRSGVDLATLSRITALQDASRILQTDTRLMTLWPLHIMGYVCNDEPEPGQIPRHKPLSTWNSKFNMETVLFPDDHEH